LGAWPDAIVARIAIVSGETGAILPCRRISASRPSATPSCPSTLASRDMVPAIEASALCT
jgi:hypothetical protein